MIGSAGGDGEGLGNKGGLCNAPFSEYYFSTDLIIKYLFFFIRFICLINIRLYFRALFIIRYDLRESNYIIIYLNGIVEFVEFLVLSLVYCSSLNKEWWGGFLSTLGSLRD